MGLSSIPQQEQYKPLTELGTRLLQHEGLTHSGHLSQSQQGQGPGGPLYSHQKSRTLPCPLDHPVSTSHSTAQQDPPYTQTCPFTVHSMASLAQLETPRDLC